MVRAATSMITQTEESIPQYGADSISAEVSEPIAQANVVWIYPGPLHIILDAATWLDTTQYLRETGYDVTLIHAGPSEIESINGVDVVSIPKPDIYLVRQAIFHFRVWRHLAARWNDTDIVFFHHMSLLWLLPWRILRMGMRRSRPIFIKDTRTAPMIPKEVGTRRDSVRTVYDNAMNRIGNYVTDGQTAITRRMAAMMGIPDEQLLGVWPSGVDLETFAAARQERDWSDIENRIHLVYIGALHRQRNLMNFSRALEQANAMEDRFRFTMVGAGTEFDDLVAYAAQTDGRIRVLPSVPHDQMPGVLAQAHVGVLPFPDQERFRVSSPIKLFEYMASGMPILATQISCHTDVVADGDYAFWAVDESIEGLRGALESTWTQRSTLRDKGDEAAAAASCWTWEVAAQKLGQSFQRGLAR